MKPQTLFFVIISILFIFSFPNNLNAQLQITTGVNPDEMVENLTGPGISAFSNVSYQGAEVARGFFNNGETTNIGMNSGIFLCSGSGNIIPGPNDQSSAGASNVLEGHPLLSTLSGTTTLDAAVLEFDFIPINDTVRFSYLFGSEEYNEYVNSSFNDVFGFFITGPNPESGFYTDLNIALVPGTNVPVAINNVNNGFATPGVVPNGPCTNCEFFADNTSGTTLQYDGNTLVLSAWIKVIPNETYHMVSAIADAGDYIYDSGVFLEENSLFSPGSPEFTSFDFLAENNPSLSFDINGAISDGTINLEVPSGTDISNLIASFNEAGAYGTVNGVLQSSGVTANDFSVPLIYQLLGSSAKDWTVYVDTETGLDEFAFKKVDIYPNPNNGNFKIENIYGLNINIYNTIGKMLINYPAQFHNNSIMIDDLPAGVYFIQLEKNGKTKMRKITIL